MTFTLPSIPPSLPPSLPQEVFTVRRSNCLLAAEVGGEVKDREVGVLMQCGHEQALVHLLQVPHNQKQGQQEVMVTNL